MDETKSVTTSAAPPSLRMPQTQRVKSAAMSAALALHGAVMSVTSVVIIGGAAGALAFPLFVIGTGELIVASALLFRGAQHRHPSKRTTTTCSRCIPRTR